MNAEEVKVGCFQMMLVLLLGINYVIVAMSHALPVFHNYTPKFYCQARNSTSRSYGCQGVANSSTSASSIPVPSEAPALASCPGEYRFVGESAESSVVTEWGLICEKRYLSFLGPIVYHTGTLLGAWIAGYLADRIGRLPVQAICLYAQGTLAVALYVAQSYPAFLALRALQGLFVQGLQNTTYILALELLPARSRTLVALVMQISWSIGLVLLAALSYAIPDWRVLQLAVSVPTAITVLYVWIIPESPRWLLARGRSTEADMALERIAKYNSCCVRSRTKNTSEQEASAESKTPTKPERKSRVSSADLQKAQSDGNQRKEATNLLTGLELIELQITERISQLDSANVNDGSSQWVLRRETRSFAEDFDKNFPSSSKEGCDRKSRETSHSGCDQKIALKAREAAKEMILLYRAKKEKTSKDKEKIENDTQKQATDKTSSRLKGMFGSSILRRYGVIMICQWFASALACSILEDLAPNFSINRHITFASGGLLEIAACTFMYFVLSKYGRRLPMCIYQSFNGINCILIAGFFISTRVAASWSDLAKTIILLFSRVTIASTVSIAYLYTVEIFPTVVRGSCLGLCVVFAEIGNLCIPHLLLSGQLFPVRIPLILGIGVLCLVYGVYALILPETLYTVLPDRATDVDRMISNGINKNNDANTENNTREDSTERRILREKLFSEDRVDAGNGILVNFSENKNAV